MPVFYGCHLALALESPDAHPMQWRKPSALQPLRCMAALTTAVKKVGVPDFTTHGKNFLFVQGNLLTSSFITAASVLQVSIQMDQ